MNYQNFLHNSSKGSNLEQISSDIKESEEISFEKFPKLLRSVYDHGLKIEANISKELRKLDVGSEVAKATYNYCYKAVDNGVHTRDTPTEFKVSLAWGLTYAALRGMGYKDTQAQSSSSDNTATEPEVNPAYIKARTYLSSAMQKHNLSGNADEILAGYSKAVAKDANIQNIKALAKSLAINNQLTREGMGALLELAKEVIAEKKA